MFYFWKEYAEKPNMKDIALHVLPHFLLNTSLWWPSEKYLEGFEELETIIASVHASVSYSWVNNH